MQYLCLVYGEEAALGRMTPEESNKLDRDSLAYDKVLEKSGHMILAHALKSTREATSVRMRGGRKHVTDGPFAETKEQLLGFILIDALDRDEATEIASAIPLAATGTIEVRPVDHIDPD